MYFRERFGNSEPADDNKAAVLSHESSAETAQQGASVTASRAAAGDGAGAIAARGGRPSVMLPPRRMRPSMLDFPAGRALDNLRARRLNVSGSSGIRSTSAGVTGVSAARAAVTTRSADGFHINNATANGSTGNHSHSSGELWTDGKGTNNGRQPASPARPRRRRPVSASAVCEGPAPGAMGLDDSEAARREGDRATGTALHGGPQTNNSRQKQRARRGESTSTVRTQRPRSARAALQRPPPAATDYHYHSSINSGIRGSEKEYCNQWPLQQEQQRQGKRSRPSSAAFLSRATGETWMVPGVGKDRGEASAGRSGGGERAGRGLQRFSREKLLPRGSIRGVTTPLAPEEEERTWLRSR